MGFENREYYRESYGGGGRVFGESTACLWLAILTVGVFIAQNVKSLQVENWLALNAGDVMHRGQVWRLLTYAFCHKIDDLSHLAFNLLGLWFFGRAIEERLGRREFVAFYLVSAVFAGACHISLELVLRQPPTSTIGASGAVLAILALFAMWYPRQQVLFMLLIPIEIRWLIIAIVAMDTIPIWRGLAGIRVSDGIAHTAHLGGLLFGFLYQFFELRLGDWVRFRQVPGWWRDRQRRRSMRLYRPEPEVDTNAGDLDDRVDQILRKIHDHGEASLTEAERELLNEASRRYRERTKI